MLQKYLIQAHLTVYQDWQKDKKVRKDNECGDIKVKGQSANNNQYLHNEQHSFFRPLIHFSNCLYNPDGYFYIKMISTYLYEY